MVSFQQALDIVREKVTAARSERPREVVPLAEAHGRVLAEDVAADRDYPPFHRSIRDGFAVRAEDVVVLPAELELRGEVRAGEYFDGSVRRGECVSIMTGAPLPAGADSVVMVEYTESHGNIVKVLRLVRSGQNIVRQGSEARAGTRVLPRGRRLGAGEAGLIAAVGNATVPVFARPVAAILPTGDELVPVEQKPEWFQIRNSNASSLAAQVSAAGGVPQCLAIVPDRPEALRNAIQQGLGADLLLLSGGVSAGKYDFVEPVLADLGAEFYFQSVAIRPGKPLVFGRMAEKFFFGLPGNPISSFVTFALFVRPALAFLGGADFEPPVFLRARLGKSFEPPAGLTTFVPARRERVSGAPVARPVDWQGSGDLVGVAAADCFIVAHSDGPRLAEGDWVDVMMREQ